MTTAGPLAPSSHLPHFISGVWQALCELYDRPAEIYAFDPVEGARKLRVFHSSRADMRPPIRLSYYGGGHYDSIVGPGWEANLLRDAPGVVEARRIVSSRSSAAAGGVAQTAALSAEDAAVAAALARSREEFDEAAENIDAALLSVELAASAAAAGLDPRLAAVAQQSVLQGALQGQASASPAAASSSLEGQILQQVLRSSELDDDSMAVQTFVMAQTRAAADEEAFRAAMQASLVDAAGVGGIGSSERQSGNAAALPDVDDPELQAAMARSLGSAVPPGELDALYNFGLDMTEEQQLARLLQLSREEDVQRERRTRLAQEDMQQQLRRQQQPQQHEQFPGPRHPDNVAVAAESGAGGSASSTGTIAATTVVAAPSALVPHAAAQGAPEPRAGLARPPGGDSLMASAGLPDGQAGYDDEDEEAMLQAAIAASLGPHPSLTSS